MKILFKKACTLTIATALSLCAVPFQTQNIINSVMAEDSDYLTTESGLYYKINNDEIIITGCDDKLKDMKLTDFLLLQSAKVLLHGKASSTALLFRKE